MLFARSSLNQGLAPVRPHTNSAEHDKSIAGELYKLARELEKMEEKWSRFFLNRRRIETQSE